MSTQIIMIIVPSLAWAKALMGTGMADYLALEETAYLLRSPKNTRRLIEAVAELEDGKGQEKELIE